MSRDNVQALSAALQPTIPWSVAYAAVEAAVTATLSDPDVIARLHLEQQTLSTKELVELLWPETLARGPGITTRKRLFKALAALATRGLSPYCTQGEPTRNKRLGRDIRPWRWHSKKERSAGDRSVTFSPQEYVDLLFGLERASQETDDSARADRLIALLRKVG